MKEYTDIEIIECLRNRDSYVVRHLYVECFPVIKYMVTQMGGSTEDAKDIFQEGLMIILEKIDRREFSLTSKFKTFLYCICEKLWKGVLIKRQTVTNYIKRRLDTEEETDFSEHMDDDLHRQIIRNAFDDLNDAEKRILRLYWDGFSPQEIALKLNLSYAYVRKTKSKAQTELVDKVKNHPEFENIKRRVEMVNDLM